MRKWRLGENTDEDLAGSAGDALRGALAGLVREIGPLGNSSAEEAAAKLAPAPAPPEVPLYLNCSREIGMRRLESYRAVVDESWVLRLAVYLRVHVILGGVLLAAMTFLEVLGRLLSKTLLCVPLAYAACNLLRHVDTPGTSMIAATSVGVRTATPFIILSELQLATGMTTIGLANLMRSAAGWPEAVSGLTGWLGMPILWYVGWSTTLILAVRREAVDEQRRDARAAVEQMAVDGGGGSGGGGGGEPELMCRICMDGDEAELASGLLLSPCLCRGGMRYVHVECLNLWRSSSQNPDSVSRCDTCKFVYSMKRTHLATIARSGVVVNLAAAVLLALCVLAAAHISQVSSTPCGAPASVAISIPPH